MVVPASLVAQNAAFSSQCANIATQGSCARTCATLCSEQRFFAANAQFCIENAFEGGVPGQVSDLLLDTDVCSISAPETATSANPESDIATVELDVEGATSEECAGLASLTARRQCERDRAAPSCARNFDDLEGQARLLVRQINGELGQYGDLLTRDWTAINNRDALCELSLADLDNSFVAATEDPDALEILQGDAREIQSCHDDWIVFAEARASSRLSDVVVDQSLRDAAARLSTVANTISHLDTSIATLRGAAETIVGIVDTYLIFCSSD